MTETPSSPSASPETRSSSASSGRSSIPVEITRKFNAPVEAVWRAWSDPALVKQWWGPENYTCPEAMIDFRVGGKYRMAMRDAKGVDIWSGGEYRVIDEPRRIACTDRFTDAQGNPVDPKDVGMPGDWPDELFVTIDFEPEGKDGTTMRLKHVGIPTIMHDDCVDGWTSSLDKFQRLVERS